MTEEAGLSFSAPPNVKIFCEVAEKLRRRYGEVPEDGAKTFIDVGGDGTFLYRIARARGRLLYPIVPRGRGAKSVGYTCNRHDGRHNLLEEIAKCDKIPLHPLDIKIQYANGERQNLKAYSSFAVEHDSGQAAIIKLSARFNGVSKQIRTVGGGLVFTTSMGATGQNYSNGGPLINIMQPAMIFSGTSTGTPRGLNPIVATGEETFILKCIVSKGKRALRIDMDGKTIRPSPDNPFDKITVALSPEPAAILGIKKGSFHPFRRLTLP